MVSLPHLVAMALLLGGACTRNKAVPPDPLSTLSLREPSLRLNLGRAGRAMTPLLLPGDPTILVMGLGDAFLAVDPHAGRLHWRLSARGILCRPMARGREVLLAWVAGSEGTIVRVDAKKGTVLQRTTLRARAPSVPDGLPLALTPEPVTAGDLVLWPTSRYLFAFDLPSASVRWVHEAEQLVPLAGATRRMRHGSDPPIVDRSLVVWGHHGGVTALDLSTGRLRWSWRAYRGFALPSLLAGDVLYSTTDASIVALDPRSGAKRWEFLHEGIRFEHLSGESRLGLMSHLLWFVSEPSDFRYRVFALSARDGRLAVAWEPVGAGLSAAPVEVAGRLYLGHHDTLVAYDLVTGRPGWRAALGSPPEPRGIVVHAERLWVVTRDGTLFGLSL